MNSGAPIGGRRRASPIRNPRREPSPHARRRESRRRDRPRKVLTVGGGPAGLYLSLLLAKQSPDAEVTVVERNPANATYGFGVLFSDRTLNAFREADLQTYTELTERFIPWDAITVRRNGAIQRSGGHVFAGISRMELLKILQTRCHELGVSVKFETELTDLSESSDDDLIVGADGINSNVRQAREKDYRSKISQGACKYIWLGARAVLDSFTFVLRDTPDGLFRVHAYPYDAEMSTVIVECREDTWRHAGLDQATEGESVNYCQQLLASDFRDLELVANRSQWLSFAILRVRNWSSRNTVLLGDAAHTAHFSIGSGTKLAMEDAAALARAVERHDSLRAAFSDYEMERKPVVQRFQAAAEESRRYFEEIERYSAVGAEPFAFHLLTRSGRISYDDLRVRDQQFVTSVDREFAAGASVNGNGRVSERGSSNGHTHCAFRLAAAPIHQPFTFSNQRLANRLAVPVNTRAREDGSPVDLPELLQRSAETNAALLCTKSVAVSALGRFSDETSGLYTDQHAGIWANALSRLREHSNAKVLVRLDHAGPRGATRARHRAVDVSLSDSKWPLVAASSRVFSEQTDCPEPLDERGMESICDEFIAAAQYADSAGVDILQVQMAQGTLLASFLSPLSNDREDEFGGSLSNRMRFPLRVVEAIRTVWPSDKPLSVAIPASDYQRGGWRLDDAIVLCRELVERNLCDLVEPLAGHASASCRPPYARGWLNAAADRLRNEAGCPVLVGGHLTTLDEVNTLLAGGRADVCLLSTRRMS